MNFLIFIIIAAVVYYFWKKNKDNKEQNPLEILAELDRLGEIKGRRISDLKSILGDPFFRDSKDGNIVIWQWEIAKVGIVAHWNRVDNDKIVSFFRTDKSGSVPVNVSDTTENTEPENNIHGNMMSGNGNEIYVSALKIIASEGEGEGRDKKVFPLLLDALQKGLKEKKDEAHAHIYLGDIYLRQGLEAPTEKEKLSVYQRSVDYYKKAFTLKKGLPPHPDYEKLLWNPTREKFGALLCHMGDIIVQDAVKLDDFGKAKGYCMQSVEYTDYPLAHNLLGVLYKQNNDKVSAIKHWKYIIDNKEKLNIFSCYDKAEGLAKSNLFDTYGIKY